MNKVVKGIIIAAVAAAVGAAAFFLNRSVDEVDETTQNDVLIDDRKNTTLPEGLEVFAADGSRPALWKVTSSDGKTLYVSGAIHSMPHNVYPVSDEVKKAFDACDSVAVEIKSVDIADIFIGKDVPRFSPELPEGDELKNHLAPDIYSHLEDYLSQHGGSIDDVKGYYPYYVSNNLYAFVTDAPTSKAQGKYGFDYIIQVLANIDEKPIYSIETQEAKARYYPEMPEESAGYMLDYELKTTYDEEKIFSDWCAGDVDGIFDIYYSKDGLTDEQLAVREKYVQYCITDRNYIMKTKAEEYLSSGKTTFLVVGICHLSGDEGVPALLEKDGYSVERIL